jgi:o-succinylbenzoate---CoA ligase
VERILVDELGWSGCVVVSGHHDEWGHVPVVVSVTARDLDQARGVVGSRLGVHARPDRVVVVPEMPVLASGKPDRVALTRLVSQ